MGCAKSRIYYYTGTGETPKHACKNLEETIVRHGQHANVIVALGDVDTVSPLSPRSRTVARPVVCRVDGRDYYARIDKTTIQNKLEFRVTVEIEE